jgi:erythrin-vacuolar iron transport family protein
VQPALAGMMDGSVSTLAPLFATALATRDNHTTFLVPDTTLAEIADRVGYSSVYAFATAFRRHRGEFLGC